MSVVRFNDSVTLSDCPWKLLKSLAFFHQFKSLDSFKRISVLLGCLFAFSARHISQARSVFMIVDNHRLRALAGVGLRGGRL